VVNQSTETTVSSGTTGPLQDSKESRPPGSHQAVGLHRPHAHLRKYNQNRRGRSRHSHLRRLNPRQRLRLEMEEGRCKRFVPLKSTLSQRDQKDSAQEHVRERPSCLPSSPSPVSSLPTPRASRSRRLCRSRESKPLLVRKQYAILEMGECQKIKWRSFSEAIKGAQGQG